MVKPYLNPFIHQHLRLRQASIQIALKEKLRALGVRPYRLDEEEVKEELKASCNL